jgi:Fur family ferric uptake transcriptional regulator
MEKPELSRSNEHNQNAGSVDLVRAFQRYLAREGLKNTRQRELIVDQFAQSEGHVSVEDLLNRVRGVDASVGYATVYRTLRLLVDAGLASVRQFGEGFRRFEPFDDGHHDHLICEACGRIEEFHDRVIEQRQAEVARMRGYRLTRHRHELFGICRECQSDPEAAPGSDSSRSEASGNQSNLVDAFEDFLAREGLKQTRQRQLIASLFAESSDHVSVEDLLGRVKEIESAIGYATVYRTLKLLVEAGLASCRHFGDGFTRFEPFQQTHHDHLICEVSGRIVEFRDELIEQRQQAIAAEHGYRLTRHRHDLYGIHSDEKSE